MLIKLSSAISAYKAGNYEEAVSSFLLFLEDNRLDWWAWFYLGLTYSKLGRTENAYRIMQVIGTLCSDPVVKKEARTAIAELEDDLFGIRQADVAGELRLSA